MYTFDIEKQLFCDNPQRFENRCSKKYLTDEPASVIEVNNAIILPCKKSNEIPWWQCEGGICDSNGDFIAGQFARNTEQYYKEDWYDCVRGYKFDKKIVYRNETVVFGGILNQHFGHFLADSISRLWYVVKNKEKNYKVVFLNFPTHDCTNLYAILYAIGLKEENFEIINQITQFEKIIIPDQTLFRLDSYKAEAQIVFDEIISNVKPASYKKIYLSKSKFDKNTGLQEIYFEDFYKKRGFEIIYPETLPFNEQVAILNGADEIACTMGTIQHLTFFCKDGAKVTVFTRDYNTGPINILGVFSLQMRNIESYFVDIIFNFLPTAHAGSTYFFGPTKYWINYLNSQNIEYELDEVSFDIHVKPYVYDYLINWAKFYNKKIYEYTNIKNYKLSDLINIIHRTFLGETIDVSKFSDRDDVVKLKEDNKQLTDDLAKSRKHTDLKDIAKQTIIDMGIPQNFELLEKQIKINENNLTIMKKENDLLIKENLKLQLQINSNKLENYKLNGQLKWARKEIDKLRCSKSYKLGKMITWLPHKIRDIFK